MKGHAGCETRELNIKLLWPWLGCYPVANKWDFSSNSGAKVFQAPPN